MATQTPEQKKLVEELLIAPMVDPSIRAGLTASNAAALRKSWASLGLSTGLATLEDPPIPPAYQDRVIPMANVRNNMEQIKDVVQALRELVGPSGPLACFRSLNTLPSAMPGAHFEGGKIAYPDLAPSQVAFVGAVDALPTLKLKVSAMTFHLTNLENAVKDHTSRMSPVVKAHLEEAWSEVEAKRQAAKAATGTKDIPLPSPIEQVIASILPSADSTDAPEHWLASASILVQDPTHGSVFGHATCNSWDKKPANTLKTALSHQHVRADLLVGVECSFENLNGIRGWSFSRLCALLQLQVTCTVNPDGDISHLLLQCPRCTLVVMKDVAPFVFSVNTSPHPHFYDYSNSIAEPFNFGTRRDFLHPQVLKFDMCVGNVLKATPDLKSPDLLRFMEGRLMAFLARTELFNKNHPYSREPFLNLLRALPDDISREWAAANPGGIVCEDTGRLQGFGSYNIGKWDPVGNRWLDVGRTTTCSECGFSLHVSTTPEDCPSCKATRDGTRRPSVEPPIPKIPRHIWISDGISGAGKGFAPVPVPAAFPGASTPVPGGPAPTLKEALMAKWYGAGANSPAWNQVPSMVTAAKNAAAKEKLEAQLQAQLTHTGGWQVTQIPGGAMTHFFKGFKAQTGVDTPAPGEVKGFGPAGTAVAEPPPQVEHVYPQEFIEEWPAPTDQL